MTNRAAPALTHNQIRDTVLLANVEFWVHACQPPGLSGFRGGLLQNEAGAAT